MKIKGFINNTDSKDGLRSRRDTVKGELCGPDARAPATSQNTAPKHRDRNGQTEPNPTCRGQTKVLVLDRVFRLLM